MSVGEWLNAAIAESAHDPDGYAAQQPDQYQDTFERASPIADIHARLDAIGRQIDRISPRAMHQQAPVREGGRALAHQLDDAISRIDRQLDQLSARASSPAPQAPQRPVNPPAQAQARTAAPAAESEFDRMVAAFGARRGELNGAPARPAAPAPRANAHIPPPAQPQIDLAGLERQLQHITGRIEALHQPGPMDAAIASFREELAEIRRSLTEALPRKAVESIEHEIRALAHRIDNSRQCGADGAALANIERALGDILNIVRGLTPAEQLAGYDNAIRALSDKIDHIVRDSREPGAIDQLEGAIAALKDIASRVASHEVLDHLRQDIQHLAEKVGSMPQANDDSASLLGALEQRIAVLTEALESRPPQAAQDFSRVEGAMQALSARIDQLQPGDNPPETDPAAYLRLEARIGELLGRIDASSAQFSRFGDIERNLENILAEIERQREAIETGSRRAAGADMPDFGDVIRREMSDLRFSQSEAERRMQDSLETVHTTLGHVVDRLAQIEGDLRERRPSPFTATPAPLAAPATVAAAAMPARAVAAAPRMAPDTPPTVPDAPALAPVTTGAPPPAPRPSLDNPARGMAGSEPAFAPAASSIASALSRDTAHDLQPAMRERAPAVAPQRPASGPRRPIDENLPPDFPIEPGTRPARPAESAAARIAASESVLDQTPPRDGASDSVAATANPSSFIAAARRAARTAATQAGVAKTPDRPAANAASQSLPANSMLDDDGARAKGTFSNRLRQILVGASVVVIVLAVLRVVLSLTGGEDEAKAPPPAAEKSSFVVPPTGSPSLPALQPDTRVAQKTASGLLDRPSLLAPPASEAINAPPAGYLGAPGAAGHSTSESAPVDAGVTGSVAGKIAAIVPAEPEPEAKPAPRLPKFEGELPAAIGNNALREAALAGDAAAAFEIATRYAEGKGVAVNYPDAAVWFERAAKAGIVPAMFRSGSLYEKGLGVKKDFAVARDYYVAAAERGNAKAMHNLAVLFADGGGKGPDYVNAAKWFRKAADHGLADSQYNLGILYARGIGVPQNLAESFKWFSLAAAQGDADAGRKRDDVAKRLDAQSMTAARLAVQTFAPESQPDDAINVAGMRAEWGETGGKQKARTNTRQTKAAAGPQRLPSARPSAADQARR